MLQINEKYRLKTVKYNLERLETGVHPVSRLETVGYFGDVQGALIRVCREEIKECEDLKEVINKISELEAFIRGLKLC